MPNNNSSKCQLVQLHIDAYLDDELEAARATEFREHLAQCRSCRQELAFAEHLHREVVGLPILDCRDQALEPIDRLFAAGSDSAPRQAGGFREALAALIVSIPVPLRVGIPLAAVLLLVVGLNRGFLLPASSPELAGEAIEGNTEVVYTEAEIVKAMQDLELALDYLGQISERTEVLIEDRFLLRQLEDSINASFSAQPKREADDANGPI